MLKLLLHSLVFLIVEHIWNVSLLYRSKDLDCCPLFLFFCRISILIFIEPFLELALVYIETELLRLHAYKLETMIPFLLFDS